MSFPKNCEYDFFFFFEQQTPLQHLQDVRGSKGIFDPMNVQLQTSGNEMPNFSCET